LPGGKLSQGAPADIAIIDVEAEWTLQKENIASLSENSPFVGQTLKGKVDEVLVGGLRILRDGQLLDA
jgi:dihydroorotase